MEGTSGTGGKERLRHRIWSLVFSREEGIKCEKSPETINLIKNCLKGV